MDRRVGMPKDNELFQWLVEQTENTDKCRLEAMTGKPDNKEMGLRIKALFMRLRVRERQLSESEKEAIWTNIRERCFKEKKPIINRSYTIIAAAIIAFTLLTSLGYFIFRNNNQLKKNPFDYYSFVEGYAVDGNIKNVRLILPGTKEWILENKQVDLAYEKDNEININSKKIDLTSFFQKESNRLQLNLLIVPYGKLFSVLFRDGTRMWVNSGTRVVYPAVFADDKREIFVDGEVYLEVAKDAARPFVVKTKNFDVDVLGTSFNIQAYRTGPSQSVVLATGSLRVKNETSQHSSEIKPNQMYIYESNHKEISIKNVDVYDHICWKYGFLHFQSENLSTVLLRLQRYYNIHMNYNEKKMNRIIVSGKLNLKKDINSIFESISLTVPIKYQISENNIKIDVK